MKIAWRGQAPQIHISSSCVPAGLAPAIYTYQLAPAILTYQLASAIPSNQIVAPQFLKDK